MSDPKQDLERIAEITGPHARWQLVDDSDHWMSVSSQKYDELCNLAERHVKVHVDELEKLLAKEKRVREPEEERIALLAESGTTITDLEITLETTEARARELEEALGFAEGAIENAIYTEDGLDGNTGKAVLDMINPLIRTPEEMAERAKEVAQWPII